MNRENAKALLPVIQAYAEGKEIEIFSIGDKEWQDCPDPSFDARQNYRIKPQETYRPFKDAEECWSEMQKHQPFGWVKDIEDDGETWYENITSVMCDSVGYTDRGNGVAYDEFMRGFSFADGTPFGIKEGGEQ